MKHHYVDADFDGLSYGFANDNRSAGSALIRELRQLWSAVLEAAFRSVDLGAYVKTDDFRMVCEYAGVEPRVMRLAADKILRGEIAIAPRPRDGTQYLRATQ